MRTIKIEQLNQYMLQSQLAEITGVSKSNISNYSKRIDCPFSIGKLESGKSIIIRDNKTLAYIRQFKPHFSWE